MTVQELTEQAVTYGFSQKAATNLANQLWGYNLTACVIGVTGMYRNETTVYSEHTQHSGKIMGVTHTVRVSTGNIIRTSKPKEAKLIYSIS